MVTTNNLNSNDFFKSYESPPSKRTPPPPRGSNKPAATTSTTTTSTRPSYYGTARAGMSLRKPPPPRSQLGGSSNASSSTTSYYGNQTPSAYNANRSSAAVGTNYYSNHPTTTSSSSSTVPAANPNDWYSNSQTPTTETTTATTTPSTFVPSTTAASTNNTATATSSSTSDWYTDFSDSSSTAAAATTTTTTTTPSVMNPYATQPNSGTMSGSMNNHNSNNAMSGSMDYNSSAAPVPSFFTPTVAESASTSNGDTTMTPTYHDDLDNEPPLLEELGINIQHILLKTKAVVLPFRRFSSGTSDTMLDPSVIVEDADLAGPLVFALALGFELLLGLQVEFGAIYGFGVAGCLSLTLILNLMSPSKPISVWTVTSILGYALLPVNVLAALKIVLQNLAGFASLTRLLAAATVLWSTTASTRLLEVGCGMAHQRYLIAYPISLLYTAFVLLTIF